MKNKSIKTNSEYGMEIRKDLVVADSRMVAVNFGKRHDHVLRDIEKLIEGLNDVKIDSPNLGSQNGKESDSPNLGPSQKMFFKSFYMNEQNHRQPQYLMTRDGFTLLVMGFRGQKALEWKLKYIDCFNKMEQTLKTLSESTEKQKRSMDRLFPSAKSPISYIKANTIADKAVANMFGEPKAIKKEDMTEEQLKARDDVLDDVVKLMEFQTWAPKKITSVTSVIYNKYKPKA